MARKRVEADRAGQSRALEHLPGKRCQGETRLRYTCCFNNRRGNSNVGTAEAPVREPICVKYKVKSEIGYAAGREQVYGNTSVLPRLQYWRTDTDLDAVTHRYTEAH